LHQGCGRRCRLTCTNAEAGLLQRVTNEQVGPTDLLLACFDTETDKSVYDDTVIRNHLLEIEFLLGQIEGRSGLLDGIAGTPFVAVTGVENDTHGGIIANVEIGSAGDGGRTIWRQVAVALDHGIPACDQLGGNSLCVYVARADPLATCEVGGKCRLQVAVAIIKSAPVLRATIIGIAQLVRGFAIDAEITTNGQKRFARDGFGGQVDNAAAKFTGEVGRVGFLHQ